MTKLEKMQISRIALCKNPADQDARFVVVKSEDETPVEPEKVDAEEALLADAEKEAPADAPVTEPAISKEIQEYINKAIEDGIKAAIEKSPVPSANSSLAFGDQPEPDGKPEIQGCIKELVSQCNESRVVPKAIKKGIASVAKYHGVDGPSLEDDGEASAFSEISAELRAVVDILKGLTISMARQPAPAPESPSPSPSAKPVATKKSNDEIKADTLAASRRSQLDSLRFELMKAMGKDPCPPSK